MHTTRSAHEPCVEDAEPIPFPLYRVTLHSPPPAPALGEDEFLDSAEDVLDALQTVSRRITDLARELGCLGYFDDANNDRPRAA